MNPIYKEYIEFLNNNNINLDIKEGYYWLDKQIIKAFDDKGQTHKIARIFIDDNLNISVKQYKEEKFNIISWQKLIELNQDILLKLEQTAISKIQEYSDKYSDNSPIILTSGGKDSSVVNYLVRKALNNNTKAIFNNTSLDCADTYKHIKGLDNTYIMNPKEGFYQWQKKYQYIPTRFNRACCGIFKEYELVKQLPHEEKYLFFMGMRNQESSTRSNYGYEWHNEAWSSNWQGILPIRKWSELDVWLYILMRNIPINEKYKKGYARVGCAIACCFYTKSTWVLDKHFYSIMYNRWQNILKQDFIKNNKWLIMNCTLKEYMIAWCGGTVRPEPTEEVIKEFANYNNLDIDIARKYFNKTCKECNKRVKSKEVLAMNMKFLGRNTNTFMCKKHLKEFLKIDNAQWDKYVEDFKCDGCTLF